MLKATSGEWMVFVCPFLVCVCVRARSPACRGQSCPPCRLALTILLLATSATVTPQTPRWVLAWRFKGGFDSDGNGPPGSADNGGGSGGVGGTNGAPSTNPGGGGGQGYGGNGGYSGGGPSSNSGGSPTGGGFPSGGGGFSSGGSPPSGGGSSSGGSTSANNGGGDLFSSFYSSGGGGRGSGQDCNAFAPCSSGTCKNTEGWSLCIVPIFGKCKCV